MVNGVGSPAGVVPTLTVIFAGGGTTAWAAAGTASIAAAAASRRGKGLIFPPGTRTPSGARTGLRVAKKDRLWRQSPAGAPTARGGQAAPPWRRRRGEPA